MNATTKTASVVITHVIAAREVLDAAEANTAQGHRLALSLSATAAVDAPAISRQALAFALALESLMCAADDAATEAASKAVDDSAEALAEAVEEVTDAVACELASNVTAYARCNFGHADDAPKSHPKLVVDCLEQLDRLGYEIDLGDDTVGRVDSVPCNAAALDRAAAWLDDHTWQFGGRDSAEVTAFLSISTRTHEAGAAAWTAEVVGIQMPR